MEEDFMENTGLVLEGGGMRGAFTAGVLDFFMDCDMHFPYVVGASAGACNGSSYIAKQRGRNYKVIVGYGSHPEYISLKRAITKRELFGMDFIFDKLPNQLVPFHYERFFESTNQSQKFVVGATDVNTGQPVYYDQFNSGEILLKLIRASSSLPFIAPMIEHGGQKLLDGGIADPIPINPSIEAGNQKHIVVLTRNEGYVKQKMKFSWFFQKKYKEYPNLLKAMQQRHERYNETMKQLEELKEEGKVFIIRPEEPLAVSRIERNQSKLHALYEQGYKQAQAQVSELQSFLKEEETELAGV